MRLKCNIKAVTFMLGGMAYALLSPAASYAIDDTLLLREARRCTQHFARHERLHGIPTHLLAAVAATESGRYHKGLGLSLPWPWTINAEGKGYFFNSKAEVMAKVKALQATGMKSIDVGCMQVNLRHHPNAFANLDQALDPYYNVSYAAKFMRRNYADLGDWSKAAAAYHSRTPKYGNRYIAKVKKKWAQIAGKLRDAKVNEHVYNIAGNNSEQEWLEVMAAYNAKAAVKSNSKPSKKKAAKRRSKSIKSIRVSDAVQQPSGQVLIIKPTKNGIEKQAVSTNDSRSNAMIMHFSDKTIIGDIPAKAQEKPIKLTSNTTSSRISGSKNPVFIFAE